MTQRINRNLRLISLPVIAAAVGIGYGLGGLSAGLTTFVLGAAAFAFAFWLNG